jgi:starch-binding outer membrane protein, SusD/RagB family
MKAKYLSIPLAASVMLGGCNDLLTETPGGFITVETFYNTPSDINAAALAMYALLAGEWDFFKIQQHWTFELPSDQGRFHPDEPNVETQAPQFLGWTSTSRDAVQPWRMNFWLIQRANIVIERAAEVQFPNPAEQQALIGEGKFMRAFGYFWLVRAYGGVPLYTSLDAQRKADQPRATEAQVLEQIIKDASEAAEVLPAARSGNQLGRATRGAALALLADAYRWRANAVSKSREDWEKAAEAAGTVIREGRYALEPNYLDAFLPGSETRREEIFAIQFSGVGWEGIDLIGGIYFARNIPSIEGWAVVVPTPRFYHSYPAGDYRHEVTFRTRSCPDHSDTNCAESEKIDFTPHNFEGFTTRGHPHVWKYRPSDHGRNLWGAGDVNTPMYRYADILLIYAEAQVELGNSAEALRRVNEIRQRARRGTGNENRAEPADLTTISKDIIYQERSWELSFELKRWFDLVQRGEQYFVSQLTQNDPLATQHGNVRASNMRLPIPAEEIAKNSAILQNPGY